MVVSDNVEAKEVAEEAEVEEEILDSKIKAHLLLLFHMVHLCIDAKINLL